MRLQRGIAEDPPLTMSLKAVYQTALHDAVATGYNHRKRRRTAKGFPIHWSERTHVRCYEGE
ncbi:MAG: hypothetical protein ACI9OD_002071 [Limisphaerales bacterium]|jgi:hypothetical protein